MDNNIVTKNYLVADAYCNGEYQYTCFFEGNEEDSWNGFSSVYAIDVGDISKPNPWWLVNDNYITASDIYDLEDANNILERALENENTENTSFKNVRFAKVEFEFTAKSLEIQDAEEVLLF